MATAKRKRKGPGKPSTRRELTESTGLGATPVLPVRDAVHFPNLINTLLVGRDVSLRALQRALDGDRRLVVVTQRDVAVEDPKAEDLHDVGVLSETLQVLQVPDGTMRVVLRGLSRVKLLGLKLDSGSYTARPKIIGEESSHLLKPLSGRGKKNLSLEALMREALSVFEEVVQLGRQVPVEAMQMAVHVEEPGALADTIAHHLPIRPVQKQGILAEPDPKTRLEQILEILHRERDVLGLQNDIRARVEKELGDTQREYYLREQLKIIQQELDERDERVGEIQEYAQKIEAAGMPTDVRERADVELRRLERAPAASPEGMVIRTYLDWMTALPWDEVSLDSLDVLNARKVLDRDHFGLEKVKDRVLDFLAVRQVSKSLRGPILCFVGPPGVGKTSIGKSIAEALGRRFVRISLGGVRDEAEIRGHRRTYIGSMPGRIIQGIKTCGTRNPVFMLDEIDKLGMDFRGDPTSALLEALDPEQNDHFTDHYVEAPFDLSAVMFITTANLLENIPWPLRDRMEVIQFSSYTEEEKVKIAKDFLIPKKLDEHGLSKSQLAIPIASLRTVVREYTREAGVRNLDREIATICRKTARRIAERKGRKVSVDSAALHEFLGPKRYQYGARESREEIGAATGLVYTEFGGDVIPVEVSITPPSPGDQSHMTLTGQLGDVMKESAHAAVTCVRSRFGKLGLPSKSEAAHLHIHVPAGAVPKDGPSAGITIAVAYASALSGRRVRPDVAMTGEITLRGKVLPVGGIREKILAAHRSGIKNVIIPAENRKDLEEVPRQVLADIELHTVRVIEDVLKIALR